MGVASKFKEAQRGGIERVVRRMIEEAMAVFANQSLVSSICHRVGHGAQESVPDEGTSYVSISSDGGLRQAVNDSHTKASTRALYPAYSR